MLNFFPLRAWRLQTMILTCLRTTQPWSMTMRERAHWQAASAPLLQAVQMETKTTTTSTTGDHAFRNWPTCMTHVKAEGTPQKEDLCDSPPVRDTDHASGVFLDKILVQDKIWSVPRKNKCYAKTRAFNLTCLRFYWGSFGHNGSWQGFVVSSGKVNEAVKSCVGAISHEERSCACYKANRMCVEMIVHVWFCLSSDSDCSVMMHTTSLRY